MRQLRLSSSSVTQHASLFRSRRHANPSRKGFRRLASTASASQSQHHHSYVPMATRATPPSAIPHLEICRRTTARRQSHASSSILLRGAKLRRPIFIPVPPVALPSASSSSFRRRLACVVPAHLPARRQCLPRRALDLDHWRSSLARVSTSKSIFPFSCSLFLSC
ncbi:hypothetical protein ZWY2020_041638 [Hordeum vulgare]|nr:hypothetical protein ZWY2020_041638 [Hordeum vulgare]